MVGCLSRKIDANVREAITLAKCKGLGCSSVEHFYPEHTGSKARDRIGTPSIPIVGRTAAQISNP